tara:strand:- start:810 stop:2003 length:1194 start_codon:yes stop_codon:yes gene_type:complete
MKILNPIHEKNFKLNLTFLKIILILSFILISISFYEWTVERSYYEYSDWLINYQGGFTRRGLFGEIIFQLHKISSIRLDFILFFFVLSMYFLFFLFLHKILINTNLNFLNTLILFSPLSFIYLASSKTLAGRKEILLFFLLSIFFYNLKKIKFENVKYWIISILVFSSLTHLGFIFYMPFLILFFFFLYPGKKIKELLHQVVPIILTGIVVVSLVINSTFITKPDFIKVCDSIKDFVNNCPNETYISFLENSFFQVRQVFLNFFNNNYLIKYPIYFFISFLPIIYALSNLKDNKNFKKKKLIIILLISFFSTIPVFFLGADYGRYLNWQYMFVLFIYFHIINFKILKIKEKNIFFNLKSPKELMYFVIFIYGFVWSVPHCCDKNYSFLYDKLANILF